MTKLLTGYENSGSFQLLPCDAYRNIKLNFIKLNGMNLFYVPLLFKITHWHSVQMCCLVLPLFMLQVILMVRYLWQLGLHVYQLQLIHSAISPKLLIMVWWDINGNYWIGYRLSLLLYIAITFTWCKFRQWTVLYLTNYYVSVTISLIQLQYSIDTADMWSLHISPLLSVCCCPRV